MPELEQKAFQKRLVAYKTAISTVLMGEFTKDESSAGYVKINDATFSRVNIIANLVYKSEDAYSGAIIDDGSGKIPLRSFENKFIFANLDVGDAVLVIGKVREFDNERYILPEIVKKTNIEWMNARKLELNETRHVEGAVHINKPDAAAISKDIYELIKKLDDGDGVAIEDLISRNADAEKIVSLLLENGDVFEIKPGKIKVLE